MSQRYQQLLFLFSGFFAAMIPYDAAVADQSKSCSMLFDELSTQSPLHVFLPSRPLPAIISKTVNNKLVEVKVIDPARIEKQAKVFPSTTEVHEQKPLSHLEDGTYVYLMDKSRQTAIVSRRFDDTRLTPEGDPIEQYVGAHDSLYILIEAKNAHVPEVVAAGEIIVRNNKVIVVSNASGTFRGNATHLEFATSELENLGLQVTKETRHIDYSVNPLGDPHDGVAKEVKDELRMLRDPEARRLWQKTRLATARFNKAFPDVDAKKIFRIADPNDFDLAVNAIEFMGRWNNAADGETYVIQLFQHDLGMQRFERLLDVMEKLSTVSK